MTPAELNLIGTMIVQAKPEGVVRVAIGHQYNFDVTLIYESGKDLSHVREEGPTLAEAYAKADLSRLRKIAAARSAADIAAAEIASWEVAA